MTQQEDQAYERAIFDLNKLQSTTATIALAKHRNPEQILPLFASQLRLAGIQIDELDRLNIIHIGGTKGKGSTCAFVESILRHSGRKTGFYNSPHLVKVTERIRINGLPIEKAKFSAYFREIYDRLESGSKRTGINMPGYFSFLTILAFHIFLRERVDCVVLEVGIGGEYDPTNIIKQPVVCGITTLDYDHTNILGNTIEQIARTKAGITKTGVPLITVQHNDANAIQVIRARAKEKTCPVYSCEPLEALGDLELGIEGSAQKINASLACQLAKFFITRVEGCGDCRYPEDEPLRTYVSELQPFFKQALSDCSWPGRCQVRQLPGTVYFLDGAHTTKSMQNCLDWFLNRSQMMNPTVPRILMVNVIGERSKRDVLLPLTQANYFKEVLFAPNRIRCQADGLGFTSFADSFSPPSDKGVDNTSLNAQVWASLVQERGGAVGVSRMFKDTSTCIEYVEKLVGQLGELHVLVTGSLHFVGAILETLDSARQP